MSLALLFPGQGTQTIGMGRELAESRAAAAETFAQADETLGWSLSTLMWEGTEQELRLTKNAQPAILTHSVAVWRVGRQTLGEAAIAAGHSLGEFSAHVAAGTLSFEDGLRAVRLRGELMFEAGQRRQGTMAAVLGLDDVDVGVLCESVTSGTCVPANFNSPGQVVLSGDAPGVAEGMERAKRAGAKRVVELSVSGAFHSPLMAPAREGLSEQLASIPFRDPAFPVVSNVTARPVLTGEEARELLVLQLTSPVRWVESVATMVAHGADRFIEVGPGQVLCGLNRRNAPGRTCISVGTTFDLEALGE